VPAAEDQIVTTYSLKVDVDTHDGMRDGVPRLLDAFGRFGVKATFFLAFGPDNSGKAIWNLFRSKGFLKKMLRTGAPKLYGWRTALSGTLLPARLIAAKFPDLVRRISDKGHEVGVHAWDHRLWQDHLDRLTRAQIQEQFARAFEYFEKTLGRRPGAVAAPAWYATATSLQVQDGFGLQYASDIRGSEFGCPELDGYRSTTLQLPTTQPCLEELLTLGRKDLDACAEEVLTLPPGATFAVLPLHAEVEGGAYEPFLEKLLRGIAARGTRVQTLKEKAAEILRAAEPPPVIQVAALPMPGRAGRVIAVARQPAA
jgi:peptidoglycan/xylan/chitin deacetylase (PgdA/CDA1 family)